MRKLIYLFLICLWLFVEPIAALSSQSEPAIYTIQSQNIDENGYVHVLVTQQQKEWLEKQWQPQETLEQEIIFDNQLPYDLQFKNCYISSTSDNSQNLTLDIDNQGKASPLSDYLDEKSSVYQSLITHFSSLKIKASSSTSIAKLTYASNIHESECSSSYLTFTFEFEPISIQGYALCETQLEKPNSITGLKLQLWQNTNLIAVTQTDANGYYHFDRLKVGSEYQLEIENLDNYTLTQFIDEKESDKTCHDITNLQAITVTDSTQNYHIQFVQKTYRIHYHVNGGTDITDHSVHSYTIGEEVAIAEFPGMKKTGYTFTGWSLSKEHPQKLYQSQDLFIMPSHDVTFYAIWQQDIESHQQQETVSQFSHDEVIETSDDVNILYISLLLLASIGGFIIVKSFK